MQRILVFLSHVMVIVTFAFASQPAISSPWIGTIDKQLHLDLVRLSEFGVLDVAVTTYPVPWNGVAQALSQVDIQTLPAGAKVSAQRLSHYLAQQQRAQSRTFISAYLTNDATDVPQFNGALRNKSQAQIKTELFVSQVAAQIAFNIDADGNTNFDNSFIAYQFGDWNVRLGNLDQYWGNAHSTSLSKTDTARPVPSLSVSRSTAMRSDHDLLAWLGPWFATAQVGLLNDDRAFDDSLLAQTRIAIKPLAGLELGGSYHLLFDGDGRPNRDRTNHTASIDVKYTLFQDTQPLSLYAQYADSGVYQAYLAPNNAYLYGASTYLGNTKIFAESGVSEPVCIDDGATCYDPSTLIQAGYQHYGQPLLNHFGEDVAFSVVGAQTLFAQGDILSLQLRYLERGHLQQNPLLGEDVKQLTGFYRTAIASWQLKLGGSLETYKTPLGSDEDVMVYGELQYSL